MPNKYTMPISPLTVDKLGVKLYDKVSAVIAELIANSYDADARRVTVEAPMGQYLATKAGGTLTDKGLKITISDDGIGMTPEEMQAFFLVVGAERRNDSRRGSESRVFKRKVMGRKGVGKLAPFGICKVIEVISSGGEKITREEDGIEKEGFLTSHILLEYDGIVAKGDDPDEPYEPSVGNRDETLDDKTGTTVILQNFNYRRVPDLEGLSRQIAQRFGISSQDWEIVVQDNTKTPSDPEFSRKIGAFDVQAAPNTQISFQLDGSGQSQVIGPDGDMIPDLQAGFEHEGKFYPVSGWIAYSKEPYKDDLMAGVRIYCRGKIAAQTSVFNRGAGFTGEHNIRSYLVGELYADWLDEENDLIQTDRRDILWSDELGTAFQKWGQEIVLRIGKLSRDPMRKIALEVFLETGDVEKRVREAYPSDNEGGIRDRAMRIAKMFGQSISRAEAENHEVVNDLVDLSITIAPHVTFDEMMRAAAAQSETPLSVLSNLLNTARIAELSSFGRIAQDRLSVIERLKTLKDDDETVEGDLQKLINDAPWLINPEWAPITANQALASLRREFEKYYEKETGETISLSDFEDPDRRPDFVLSSQEGVIQIIEIKKPSHALHNEEMDRIVAYHDCMKSFLEDKQNKLFREFFHDFRLTLVCDGLALKGTAKAAYNGYIVVPEVFITS